MQLYKRLAMDQGTGKWLQWRHGGVTATEIAKAVGGGQGWLSVRNDKLSAMPADTGQPFTLGRGGDSAMQLGHILEPIARAAYERAHGVSLEPACIESLTHPHRRASLDGLSSCGMHAVEIKCGASMVRSWQDKRLVQSSIRRQMQYQLALLGLDSLTLVLYHAMPTEAAELQQVIRMMDYCGIRQPDWQGGPFFVEIERDPVVSEHLLGQADRLWDEISRIKLGAQPTLFDF